MEMYSLTKTNTTIATAKICSFFKKWKAHQVLSQKSFQTSLHTCKVLRDQQEHIFSLRYTKKGA